MSDVNTTLNERGNRYGSFAGHSRISQNFKRVAINTPNWSHLTDAHKEAFEMLFHKLARALNGDENYIDTYRDIIGYTQLVINELMSTEGATDSKVVKMVVKSGSLVEA
jgi:hypothetical protein